MGWPWLALQKVAKIAVTFKAVHFWPSSSPFLR
jgi:hypothetical protein